MQVVRGTEFEADDAVVAILGAELRGRTAQARDERVVDLLDREARVVGEQEGLIDGRAGREAIAGVRGHGAPGWSSCRRRCCCAGGGAALSGAQIGVGPADGLESGGLDLVVARRTRRPTRRTSPGVAGDDRSLDARAIGLACCRCPGSNTRGVRLRLSKGRALRMFTVPAAPPSSMCASELLCTVSCENSSVGNMSRSTSRLVFWESVRPVDAMATGAPLSSTLVKFVPRPRMAMLRPSPDVSRVMVMPGMRLNDSAMFVSGNLPMSSAKIESMKPTESRLAFGGVCQGCGGSR